MNAIIFDFNRTVYDPETGDFLPGVMELIHVLKEKDWKLFLVVKGGEERQALIRSLGLEKLFDEIILHPEKSLEDFRYCLEQCEKGTRFFVLGDRARKEICYGNMCNMTTIWLRRGKFSEETPETEEEQPDFVVENIDEVEKILPLE